MTRASHEAPAESSAGAPQLQTLLVQRRLRSAVLSAVVSAIYVLVALGCAFAPDVMRRPLAGSGVSIGVASMALIILVAIVTSGYYTWWSNTVIDPAMAAARARHGDRSR